MTPLSFEIFIFRLPLKFPLFIDGKKSYRRDGLLLRLQDDEGHTAFGEMAPLPGLHSELTADCARETRVFFRQHEEAILLWLNGESWASVAELTERIAMPSVRFGVESGLLHLLCRKKQTHLAELLNDSFAPAVPLNGLLFGSRDKIFRQARLLRQKGIRSFKVKVGRFPYEEEQRIIRDLLNEFPAVTLRLDANRNWSLPQALRFLQNLPPQRIEYIEEPLTNKNELALLGKESPVPVALDETLSEPGSDEFLALPGVAAAVLKPSVLGGIFATAKLAEKAQRAGLKTVLSDTFSSGVGLAVHLALAAAWGGGAPAGLDTYRYLDADILRQPLEIREGAMAVEENLRKATDIDGKMVERFKP